MTREEKIKGLYSLKEYLIENPIELEGHKSLPITLIDYAIKALEQETQWISTKERLPEKEREYLVTTRGRLDILSFAKDLYKVDKYDFWDRKDVSGWWWYDGEYGYIETDGVTAWMYLPKPYKESEE